MGYGNLLKRAEIVARLAHGIQVDKAGVPYTEHLKAVAGLVDRDDEKIVAWLHDTIEDTPLSLHDLRELGFPHHLVNAVALLTEDLRGNLSHKEYLIYIRDARGDGAEIARAVKRADLKHNADPSRNSWMPAEKLSERYRRALEILDAPSWVTVGSL